MEDVSYPDERDIHVRKLPNGDYEIRTVDTDNQITAFNITWSVIDGLDL